MISFLAVMLQAATPAPAQPGAPRIPARLQGLYGIPPSKAAPVTGPIEQVLIGPVFDKPFACVEHPWGQLGIAGDALGTDCMVIGGAVGDDGFNALYRTDGKTNEDWYGWHTNILAPFDGTILGVWPNDEVNKPGKFGHPPAASIFVRSKDGIVVVLAHVTNVKVKTGDHVSAAQIIAQVGNNGMSRSPHTHLGAFREADKMPLQIRWDQRALAKVLGE